MKPPKDRYAAIRVLAAAGVGSREDSYDCDDPGAAVPEGLTLAYDRPLCPCVDMSATRSNSMRWLADRAGSDLIGA